MPADAVATASGTANPSPRHRRPRPPAKWHGLANRLFVPAPTRPLRWGGVAVAVATIALGATVSLLRQPGLGALDTVWDEDARIFLADAAARSPVDALLTAYQGYYHVAPRLLAEIAVLFPAAWAAAVMAVLAAVVTASLAVFVFVAARAHLPQAPLRFVAAAPLVVLPLAQSELPNAMCNLHWPLLYAALWAVLWVPAGRTGRWVALGVVAVTVTSDLLALVYLPVAALRMASRRDRHSSLLTAVLVAGLAAQFAGLVLHHNTRNLAPPRLDPVWALASFGLRPVPQMLIGERLFPDEVKSGAALALAAVAWVVVIAAATVAWRRWSEPRRVLAVVLFALAVALYCEAAMAGGLAVPRYAVAPALLVLAALAALVPPRRDGPSRWTAAPMWALVGLVAVVCAVNLRLDNPRALGPSWRDEVQQARVACGDGHTRTVAVPVAPLVYGVTAVLPCGYLRQ